jgi:hypothetical protein
MRLDYQISKIPKFLGAFIYGNFYQNFEKFQYRSKNNPFLWFFGGFYQPLPELLTPPF